DSFCTYCVIPYARGPVRSMHPDEILKEVMTCVSSGVKEIVITGINVNRYGTGLITEKPAYIGEPLAELLKRIALESGIGRIRLSSVEPGLINDDFVSRISEIDAVCPHFHMALQSGSAGVLKRMNRHYTPDDYRKSAELLRRYYDDPALTTDVIVGFPGETDEEHRESMDLIKDVALYSLNVFRFSARRGTPAYSMPGQIRNSVKEARAHEMLSLCDDLRSAYEERHRGRTLRVLFEENEPDGSVSGYSKEYIRVSSPTGHPGELADIVF
nr:MiaB/RimO family radical SAM methylthiotransferase [Lachnospiraceae bacterium]